MNGWVVAGTVVVNAFFYVRTGFFVAAPIYIKRYMQRSGATHTEYQEVARKWAEQESVIAAFVWPIYLTAVPAIDWCKRTIKQEAAPETREADILRQRVQDLENTLEDVRQVRDSYVSRYESMRDQYYRTVRAQEKKARAVSEEERRAARDEELERRNAERLKNMSPDAYANFRAEVFSKLYAPRKDLKAGYYTGNELPREDALERASNAYWNARK